ncbi:hypothetical protein P1X15_21355 [Runella sp. MFBS21]|uniref:hypothetical protein n=1 Tax=Runella sp. MFBS21 TaxID=3034018 RepID=UPI0023F95EA0|nr:hypothetical protein [Runella sp. MFBS21]MDF7820181.1 hypothetical protein [Runella sp. MFBS21]
MLEFRNPHYIIPPGSSKQILSHPLKKGKAVELAIFQDHRYAFFFWSQWNRKQKFLSPPCLISLDWHQDLCFPCETEKELLSSLNRSDDGEVAFFCWAKLAGNNDGHILSAAYLNLIGNIYVHCRQGKYDQDWEDEELIDIHGNKHTIKKFRTFEELEEHILSSNEKKVYFDIDLDFFTFNNPYNGKGTKFTYMKVKEIKNLLSFERPLIHWTLERLAGWTIATEPEHFGGLLKSNRILETINSIYFKPGLFTNNCDWKQK